MFFAKNPETGNSTTSHVSQDDADKGLKQLDENGNHNCHDCNNCYYCHDCNDCYNCYKCNNCNKCYNCNKCNNCHDCNDCNYCHAQPIQLLGLVWLITIRTCSPTIQIGCQDHSITFWKNISQDTVQRMDKNAVDFWNKYSRIILELAESIVRN